MPERNYLAYPDSHGIVIIIIIIIIISFSNFQFLKTCKVLTNSPLHGESHELIVNFSKIFLPLLQKAKPKTKF